MGQKNTSPLLLAKLQFGCSPSHLDFPFILPNINSLGFSFLPSLFRYFLKISIMVKRKDNKPESIRYLSEKLWKKLLNIFDIHVLHREVDNTFQR